MDWLEDVSRAQVVPRRLTRAGWRMVSSPGGPAGRALIEPRGVCVVSIKISPLYFRGVF